MRKFDIATLDEMMALLASADSRSRLIPSSYNRRFLHLASVVLRFRGCVLVGDKSCLHSLTPSFGGKTASTNFNNLGKTEPVGNYLSPG